MVSRRLAFISAAAAALFAAAGASATTLNPQVLQCDGTFKAGGNTHMPLPSIQVAVQDSVGLRIGKAGMGVGGSGATRALWRFDNSVDVSSTCAAGIADYVYAYNDPDGSDTMFVGECKYSATCGGAVGALSSSPQIPLGQTICPAGAPPLGPGAASIFPAGQFGTEATLNGTNVQFGSVTFTTTWNRDVSYTLSAWIKSNVNSTASQRILSEQGPTGYWGFGLNGNGKQGLRSFDSRDVPTASSPTASGDVTIASAINFADGSWHKVDVVRINDSMRRFYIDGNLIGTTLDTSTTAFGSSGGPPAIAHPAMIGMLEGGGENFSGQIDELRVIDAAMTDEDIRLEYTGSAIHKYSSNSGVSYSTVPGSFIGAPANGTVSLVYYSTGTGGAEAATALSAPTQRWVFEAQNVESVTSVASPFSVTIDPSLPTPPQTLSGTATATNAVQWSWAAPSSFCPPPGSASVYYQLFDAASGLNLNPPGHIAYPATSIGETVGGAPNQLLSRRMTLTDTWGASSLSASASAYTLAAAPTLLTALNVSTGGFDAAWNAAGNPAYTRYELTYSADPSFATGVSTREALGNNFTGTSINITGLASGNTYYVRVRAFSGQASDFYGGAPSAFAALAVVTEPGAPTLTGTPKSTSSVRWDWTLASGATGYTLYDSPTQFPMFGPQGYGLTFTSSTLSPNTRYDAEVEADLPAPSPPSARGHAFTYTWANPPAGPVSAAAFTSSVTYVWSANGNPAYTFYQVAVTTDPTFQVVVATLSVSSPTATATGLLPGVTYYAEVQAINGVQIPTLPPMGLPTAVTIADPKITESSSPPTPYAGGAGLTGAWQFDEDAGTTTADATGGGNAGNFGCTIQNCVSTPTWAAGPVGLGSAASFSGLLGGVVRTKSDPIPGVGSLTVEAWVYPQTTAQIPDAGVVAVGPQNAEDFALDVSPSGAFRFVTSNGGVEFPVTVATATIVACQWIHVAGVYDLAHATAALYLNGRLAATALAPARANSGDVLAVGNRRKADGTYTLPFAGRIDSVRIFSSALTAAQVLADYQGGFVSSVTPPSPNNGVVVALPPNAFGAPAQIFISADPINHPIRVSLAALNAGFTVLPAGLTMVPNSLVEVVPVVGGVPFTALLGSSATLYIPFVASGNILSGTNPPLAASGIQMYTLNTTVNRWEYLPTALDAANSRASGTTPHFSVFALFAPATIGAGASSVRAYPVPWKPGTGGRFDGPGVTFASLPASGTILVLDLAGRRVRELPFSGASAGVVVWNGLNDDGRRTASGVYFARIKSDSDGSTLLIKFAIER